MEIKCPSCGISHRTEEHPPGTFEINCVCGYGILLPEEGFGSEPSPSQEEAQKKIPLSMEQEDAELLVKIDTSPHSPLPAISETMTPPEELPQEMPYDSFELQATQKESLKEIKAAPPADEAPLSEILSAQDIVTRAQAASMGQVLGSSYDLELQNLDRAALVELSKRCEKILSKRAWLQAELRKRQIDLEKLPEINHLDNLPEILAVEIYLGAFELGGSCKSQKRSNL